MKLLIIGYLYAPDRSPRAYRWTSLAEYWAQQGHDVQIITAWKEGVRRRETQNGVNVHRVGSGVMAQIRTRLGEQSRRGKAGRAALVKSSRSWAAALAKFVYDHTWKKVYWPDYACSWGLHAFFKAFRLCRAQQFDCLITVSPPFSAHLAGLLIKRIYPAQRWLVDLGDPFSLFEDIPSNNLRLYRRLNRHAEESILTRADAVSVTVEGCRRAYIREFPHVAEKMTTIPPLVSLPPPSSANPLSHTAGAKNLVLVGTLYRQIRNPSTLLALFRRLLELEADIHLHFFGDANDCKAMLAADPTAGGRLHDHGLVSRDVVVSAMRAADVLVNIGNATSHQLPSKLVEYAAMGKPILNLASRPDDTATEMLATYPSRLTLQVGGAEPTDADVKATLDFVMCPPTVDPASLERFIAPFSREAVAAAYEQLVDVGPATSVSAVHKPAVHGRPAHPVS